MNKPATIKDIARKLNISISTVSRALRNASDVNADTRRAVVALSEELNYQPNKLALSLKQKQTHNIGVIVPNLDYVLSTMVKGIDEVALEAGYTVMVCQSNESFGREIVNTRRLLDSLVDGFIISVSSETKVFDHFNKIIEKQIPMVVFDRVTPFLKAPGVRIDNEEFWDAVIDLNLKSAYLTTRAIVPYMSEGGAIVNFSSQAARDGGGFGALAYATAKGGILTMTRGLAKELGPKGIRVNCVSPGMINTTFHNTFTKPEVRANVAAATPLRREGEAAEVGKLVLFLVGDGASFINGESVEINGGSYFA